jgi:gamma-D-glutamyl-L-lysine dipeptidyl-peptidase
MDYAVVSVPAAPLRRMDDHRSEMTSQLLFGETMRILKRRRKGRHTWFKVRGMHDGYEGWLTGTLIQETEKPAEQENAGFVTADLLNLVTIDGQKMHVPVGSSLPSFNGGIGWLGNREYEYTGIYYKTGEQSFSPEWLKQLTLSWINAPYCWGGRTPLGVDCSGFVQVIYKLMGVSLPRDAWQQAQEGKPVRRFKDAQPGDLAFFNERDEIVHVGILLGDEEVIHASGKVRMDGITKKGIIHSETKKRTLRLRAVRRVI